jgi:hypothetical protein
MKRYYEECKWDRYVYCLPVWKLLLLLVIIVVRSSNLLLCVVQVVEYCTCTPRMNAQPRATMKKRMSSY